MKTLLALILLASTAFADRAITLAWDATPNAADYVVYIDGKPVSEVTVTQAQITISDAKTVLTVTARNIGGESPPSDPLTVPASPANPKGLTIKTIIRTTVSAP